MCRQTRDSAHQLVILYNPVLCVETLLEPSLYYKLCINYKYKSKCHDLYNNFSFWPSFHFFENIIYKWCVLSEIGYLEKCIYLNHLNCSIHFNCMWGVPPRSCIWLKELSLFPFFLVTSDIFPELLSHITCNWAEILICWCQSLGK